MLVSDAAKQLGMNPPNITTCFTATAISIWNSG